MEYEDRQESLLRALQQNVKKETQMVSSHSAKVWLNMTVMVLL